MQDVLRFARNAPRPGSKLPPATPGHELLKFAGLFDPQSLKEMQEAIEEGCEQVDDGRW